MRRDRQFGMLWAGQSVSVVGDGAAAVAVPLLVLQATDSVVATALTATARTVAYLGVGLVSGALVDRWDPRRTMIFCDLLRAALFLALPAAARLPHGGWLLLGLAVVAASAGIFFETALAVTMQDILPADRLTAGNARLELSNQVGLLLGPAMIGVAIATIGIDSCLWINAATFLLSVLTVIPVRVRSRERSRRSWSVQLFTQTVRDVRTGLSYLRSRPLLQHLVSLQVVINFVVAAETLIVYHTERGLHASSTWTGIVLAAAGVGGVVAAALAGRLAERFRPQALITWSVTAIGGSLLALALATGPLTLAVANAVQGGLSVFASVHIRALRQRTVPRALLGRVTASARTLAFAANPVGAALFGVLAQAAGGNARWAFATAAVLSLASAVVAHRGLLRLDVPDHAHDQPNELVEEPQP